MSKLLPITLLLSLGFTIGGCNRTEQECVSSQKMIRFSAVVTTTKSILTEQQGWVCVDISIENGVVSGTPTTKGPSYQRLPSGSSFGISAYSIPDGIWYPGTLFPDYIYNQRVTDINGSYLYESDQYWPSIPLRFYAYYPYAPNANANGIKLPPKNVSGSPLIEFTANSEIANQFDFLVAETNVMYSQAVVPIRFRHALTKIGFSCRTDAPTSNITVKSIDITNVRHTAIQRFNNGGEILWGSAENEGRTTYKASAINGAIASGLILDNTYRHITTPQGYMLLPPQPIPENGVQLIVKYNINGIDKELQAYLPATSSGSMGEWSAGKELNYKITLNP